MFRKQNYAQNGGAGVSSRSQSAVACDEDSRFSFENLHQQVRLQIFCKSAGLCQHFCKHLSCNGKTLLQDSCECSQLLKTLFNEHNQYLGWQWTQPRTSNVPEQTKQYCIFLAATAALEVQTLVCLSFCVCVTLATTVLDFCRTSQRHLEDF